MWLALYPRSLENTTQPNASPVVQSVTGRARQSDSRERCSRLVMRILRGTDERSPVFARVVLKASQRQ